MSTVTTDTITQITGINSTAVVDVSIVPYIRPNQIIFQATGLRPTREVFYFFDATNVYNYVQKPNQLLLQGTTQFIDAIGNNEIILAGGNTADVLVSTLDLDATGNTILHITNNFALSGNNPIFQVGQTITGATSGNTAIIAAINHFSGFANASTGSINTIQLSPQASATANYYTGNNIYLTAGVGAGSYGYISSYNGTTRIATIDRNFTDIPDITTMYSIGRHYTTSQGTVCGLFCLPLNNTLYFRTGQRIFNISDSAVNIQENATTYASAEYDAGGLNVLHQTNIVQTITPVPITPPPPGISPCLPGVLGQGGTPGGTGVPGPLATIGNYTDQDGAYWTQTLGAQTIWVTANNAMSGTVSNASGDTWGVPLWLQNYVLGLGGNYDGFGAQLLVFTDSNGCPTNAWDKWDTNLQNGQGGGVDPLAETFFIPVINFPNGVFAHSIDLYFKTKDNRLPVSIEIRPTVNGYPSSNSVIKWSQVTMDASDVKISDNPDPNDASTYTRFIFPNPIFLEPGAQYALVVKSASTNYDVYVAEMGQPIIGSTRIISQQPYIGVLFKGSNSTTWTAAQTEDLMFRINRCVFNTNGGTLSFANGLPSSNVLYDLLNLTTADNIITGTNAEYSYKALNSGWVDNDFSRDSTFTPLNSNKNTNLNKRKVIASLGTSLNVGTILSTTSDAISPVIDLNKIGVITTKNIINNANVTNSSITITNYGYNYANASNISLIFTGGGSITSANGYIGAVANGNIASVIIDAGGSYFETSANVNLVSTDTTITSNATVIVASETDPSGGLAIAKYITRQVVLAEGFDAGDLRAFITAYKPNGTDIKLYYKILSADDPDAFVNKNYYPMVLSTPANRFSLNQSDTIEYTYQPSQNSNTITYTTTTGTFNTFRSFAIKMILLADYPTVVPNIQNLRVIALPGTLP